MHLKGITFFFFNFVGNNQIAVRKSVTHEKETNRDALNERKILHFRLNNYLPSGTATIATGHQKSHSIEYKSHGTI